MRDYIFNGLDKSLNPELIKKLDHVFQGFETIKTNILQASHHGAETHGSNEEEWLQRTNPEFVVFSAGFFGGSYLHPRYSVVKRVLDQCPLLERVSGHEIHCGGGPHDGSKNQPGLTYKRRQEGIFSIMETNKGIFDTGCQGDIHFQWKDTDDKPAPAPARLNF